MKTNAYFECYERIKTARKATPVNTNELQNIRDYFGYDLYIKCLRDIIEKNELK